MFHTKSCCEPEVSPLFSCFYRSCKTYRGRRRLSSYQRRVFTAGVLKVGVLSPVELKHAVRSNMTCQEQRGILHTALKIWNYTLRTFKSPLSFQHTNTLWYRARNMGVPSPSSTNTELHSWSRELWVSQASQLESNSCICWLQRSLAPLRGHKNWLLSTTYLISAALCTTRGGLWK